MATLQNTWYIVPMKSTYLSLLFGKILLGTVLLLQTSCVSKGDTVHIEGLLTLKQSESVKLETTTYLPFIEVTNHVDVSIKQGEKEVPVSKGIIEKYRDVRVVKTSIPSEKLKMFATGEALIIHTITEADTGALVLIATQNVRIEP